MRKKLIILILTAVFVVLTLSSCAPKIKLISDDFVTIEGLGSVHLVVSNIELLYLEIALADIGENVTYKISTDKNTLTALPYVESEGGGTILKFGRTDSLEAAGGTSVFWRQDKVDYSTLKPIEYVDIIAYSKETPVGFAVVTLISKDGYSTAYYGEVLCCYSFEEGEEVSEDKILKLIEKEKSTAEKESE